MPFPAKHPDRLADLLAVRMCRCLRGRWSARADPAFKLMILRDGNPGTGRGSLSPLNLYHYHTAAEVGGERADRRRRVMPVWIRLIGRIGRAMQPIAPLRACATGSKLRAPRTGRPALFGGRGHT